MRRKEGKMERIIWEGVSETTVRGRNEGGGYLEHSCASCPGLDRVPEECGGHSCHDGEARKVESE